MLVRVLVHNSSGTIFTVHSEDPGPDPHRGHWINLRPGESANVWVIDSMHSNSRSGIAAETGSK